MTVTGGIFTGPFIAVDWISGALYILSPDQVSFELRDEASYDVLPIITLILNER